MRAVTLLALASCAPAAVPPGEPPVERAASAVAAPSASAPQPPAPPRVAVAGECRASERKDCFTSADGFRALHPWPLAVTLNDIAVLPSGEVWIAGESGTLVRIERTAGKLELSKIEVPKTPTLLDTVREIDGRSFDPAQWPGAGLMQSDFDAISAASATDVWIAIGEGNAFAHWNGTTWTVEDMPSFAGGDALMRDERGHMWFGGALGAGLFSASQELLVYESKDGRPTPSKGPKVPTKKRLRALAKQGDDVWAAGFDGALFRAKKGAPFQAVPVPGDLRESFWDLWLDPTGSAGYLLGDSVYRKRGDKFDEKLELRGTAYDLWAAPGGTPVWAVGFWAYRSEGEAFTQIPIRDYRGSSDSVVSLLESRFQGVDGRSADDVWMVGAMGGIYHYDGVALREPFPRQTDDDIVGIEWTSDRAFVAATGDGKLLAGSLDSDEITFELTPMKDMRSFRKLPSGDVVAAYCSDVQIRSAAGWKALKAVPGCVRRVAGRGPDDLWAIGTKDLDDGYVWRFKNGKWSRVVTGLDKELYDVAVAPDGTAWIGGDGVLFRSSGDSLAVVARHEYDEYRALAVKSADDVWIAGDSNEIGSAGLVVHWTGKKLERFERVAGNFLDAIALGPSGEIWVAGLGGVGARFDGSKFTPIATGTDKGLEHLLLHPNGTLLAGGDGATLLRRDTSTRRAGVD